MISSLRGRFASRRVTLRNARRGKWFHRTDEGIGARSQTIRFGMVGGLSSNAMTSPLPPVWRDYRTRRRVLVAVIVGLVPVLTRAGTALRGLTGGDAAHHLLASA